MMHMRQKDHLSHCPQYNQSLALVGIEMFFLLFLSEKRGEKRRDDEI